MAEENCHAELQSDLDKAMRSLLDARDEKSDKSCLGTIGAGLSGLGALVGVGISACGGPGTVVGLGIAMVCAIAFVQSVRAYAARPPSQDEAEAQITAVAARLEGVESLRLYELPRSNLHRLLYEAMPDLAMAVLRILAVAGDASSLKVARNLARDDEPFSSHLTMQVRREAARAAKQIERRLEIARRRSTLLRPAASGREQELLRPASGTGCDDPEQLLRAEVRPEDGNGGKAGD